MSKTWAVESPQILTGPPAGRAKALRKPCGLSMHTWPHRTAGARSWIERTPAAQTALVTKCLLSKWAWHPGLLRLEWDPTAPGLTACRLPALQVCCRVCSLAFCGALGIPTVQGWAAEPSCWQRQCPFYPTPESQPVSSVATCLCHQQQTHHRVAGPNKVTCAHMRHGPSFQTTEPSRMTCAHASSVELQLCLPAHDLTAYQPQHCDLVSSSAFQSTNTRAHTLTRQLGPAVRPVHVSAQPTCAVLCPGWQLPWRRTSQPAHGSLLQQQPSRSGPRERDPRLALSRQGWGHIPPRPPAIDQTCFL